MAVRSFLFGFKVFKFVSPIHIEVLPNFRCSPKSIKTIFSISSHCQYSSFLGANNDVTKDQKKVPSNRNKNDNGPKITLIGSDNSLIVTSLQDAQKMSRRRDLKLVKMVDFDTKTERAVYKMMTGAEYFEEDKKQRLLKAAKKEATSKGEKMVTLSHRISAHDVQSRVNNISKWLSKNYEVRVIINGESSSMESAEKVFGLIDDAMKEHGRITQKRQKGNDIRFQIIPPKKKTKKQEDSDVAQPHSSSEQCEESDRKVIH